VPPTERRYRATAAVFSDVFRVERTRSAVSAHRSIQLTPRLLISPS